MSNVKDTIRHLSDLPGDRATFQTVSFYSLFPFEWTTSECRTNCLMFFCFHFALIKMQSINRRCGFKIPFEDVEPRGSKIVGIIFSASASAYLSTIFTTRKGCWFFFFSFISTKPWPFSMTFYHHHRRRQWMQVPCAVTRLSRTRLAFVFNLLNRLGFIFTTKF